MATADKVYLIETKGDDKVDDVNVRQKFAILLAADCKSADPKEVRSFFDDGFQIRRSA